jgi:hippurate hydrolase
MIRAGALDGVHEVYGWHNWTSAPVGTLLLTDGTIMAHDADFHIVIRGRGGHVRMPGMRRALFVLPE